MQQSITYNRWVLSGALITLLGSIALFAFTGHPAALFVPFAFVYLLLVIRDWKAAYWLLLFSVPLSIQLDLSGDSLSTTVPDEPLIWLYFCLFFLIVAATPSQLPEWFYKHPLTVVITLQFLWLIVSVVFSEELMLSVKYLIAKSWYLVCFFAFPLLVIKSKQDLKKAFLLLLLPIVLTAIIIIIRHKARGFEFMAINGAIGIWYYNHVEYSTVLSMFFPLVLVALPLTKGRSLSVQLMTFVVLIFFLPAIFLTYARAAILGVVFAVAVGIAIRLKLVNLIMPAFYALIIAAVLYMASDERFMNFAPNYEQTYMHKNLADHIIATFRGEDMSSMERIHRWIAAIRMSNEKPATGFGPHAFVEHYKAYTVPAFRTYVSDNPERSTTHNYFLLMLTEQGWPGMILYAVLIPFAFASAQRTYHRLKDRFLKYVTLGLAMTIACCFVNNFFSELIETHKVGALFYLSLSLLVIISRWSKESKTSDIVQGT